MRRTDRLFELIQILRDGRLHTARDMADRLEVSTRTLWRDMATLIASGLPVEGERGVGYILREPITMPPLTLTPDEVQALTLGLQLVSRGADPSLTRAAESLLGKVSAVLPARLLEGVGQETWVFPGDEALAAARHLPALRRAIRLHERVVIDYVDGDDIASERPLRPLLLEFWGRVWTLAAWCERAATSAASASTGSDRFTQAANPFPTTPAPRWLTGAGCKAAESLIWLTARPALRASRRKEDAGKTKGRRRIISEL